MVKNKSESRLSRLKSILLKYNFTLIVAYAYVWISKKKFCKLKMRNKY